MRRFELPTCPPQKEQQSKDQKGARRPYSYPWGKWKREVLHDGAPFAVVRWTNLWFPSVPKRVGFFRDWFGGPLQPLFGKGIRDIPVKGNLRRNRWIPGVAHAKYFKFPDDRTDDSVTKHLEMALALDAFRPSPTEKQISYALNLLDAAGFPTTAMNNSYAALLGTWLPAPSTPAVDRDLHA